MGFHSKFFIGGSGICINFGKLWMFFNHHGSFQADRPTTIHLGRFFCLIFQKLLLKSILLSFTTNVVPIFNTVLTKYHKNISTEKQEFLKFWMPFWSKFLAYTVILLVNFNIFLNPISEEKVTSSFYQQLDYFTPPYNSQMFICREDQSAYNMIIYVKIIFLLQNLVEFVFRNSIFLIFSIFIKHQRVPFMCENLIINTMCTFYLLNTITFVYTLQGVYTVLMFYVEFKIELYILKNLKTNPVRFDLESVSFIIN